jgi:putative heme degradation protein
MSDAYFDRADEILPAEIHCASDRSFDALTASIPPTIDRIVDALPRLGSVLWLSRAKSDGLFPRARLLAQGVVLLDHPALNSLAQAAAVRAFGAVTSHGPREWLEFRDAGDALIAKLFLLPDTDVYAWDQMLAGCLVETVHAVHGCARAYATLMRAALLHSREALQARVVRMPLLRLIGLRVLGLRAPDCVSALSRELAAAIVRDERATMQDD